MSVGTPVGDVDMGVWRDRLERLVPFDPSLASLEQLDALAPDLNAWCGLGASLRSSFAGRRAQLAEEAVRAGGRPVDHGDPEGGHQRKSKQSRRASAKDLERESTLAMFPGLRRVLSAGSVSVDHVDVVTGVVRDLTVQQRLSLRDQGDEIVVLAVAHPPEQFRTSLRSLVRTLVAEDGVRRFERQRRNTRLSAWTDPDSGMVKVFGEFDPERGALLVHALQRGLDAMYAQPVPAGCPDDPKAKNDHLRALALLELVQHGTITGAGQVDVDLVVVVDHDTLRDGVHDHTICDAGPGIELPVETLRRLACTANIIPVVLDGDGVVLDLGRSQRLANREQRRALRAMYPTCAIKGCLTRFEHCKIHHILWWGRDLGPTDLANLVPLCERHHHGVHEGGWQIVLNPTSRELTVTFPDGDVLVMPPPRQGWNGKTRSGDPSFDAAACRHPEPEPENPPDLTLWAS